MSMEMMQSTIAEMFTAQIGEAVASAVQPLIDEMIRQREVLAQVEAQHREVQQLIANARAKGGPIARMLGL